MSISAGDQLPEAKLVRIGEQGPEEVSLHALIKDRKVAIFAVPGAFTPTCTDSHMPSFINESKALADAGVEQVICIAVNDPFVLKAWDDATKAAEAGVMVLGDPDCSFTKAIGMNFDFPPAGLYGRSSRYAMLVENGRVAIVNVEASPGVCDISSAATLLEHISKA